MAIPVVYGSTDVSVYIKIVDSTDFSPEEGVTSATAGLALWYKVGATGAETALAAGDLANDEAAHTDGSFAHVNDGVYRVDLPDAAVPASEGVVTTVGGTVTGMHVLGCALVGVSRIGAPAGASIAADLAAIEGQTDDIGVAGAGLTALGDTRLANLDATVSSRSTYDGSDTAGTTTLLARLTAARAGYLDNLSAGAVALASALATAQADLTTLVSRVTGTVALDSTVAKAAKLLSLIQSIARKDVTVDADIGGTYDDATDSLEAIRDRGDAAWTTGSLGAGSITAATIATGAIDADALASDAVAEIVAALAAAGYTVSSAATTSGSTITRYRGDTWSIVLTDVGAVTGYGDVWFTIKSSATDTDAQSLIQIDTDTGLKYVNGAAYATAAHGSIVVDDAATGDFTITVNAAVTDDLVPGTYVYDIQWQSATGLIVTLTAGSFVIAADITRAVS